MLQALYRPFAAKYEVNERLDEKPPLRAPKHQVHHVPDFECSPQMRFQSLSFGGPRTVERRLPLPDCGRTTARLPYRYRGGIR